MPKANPFDRYIASGLAFSQISRKRAESIVRELVKEGAVNRDHAGDWVDNLITRTRRSAKQLAEAVSFEVKNQIDQLGLVKSDDVTRLVESALQRARFAGEMTVRTASEAVEGARRTGEHAAGPSASGATAAAKAPAKRTAAAKAPAKRTAAAKAPAKRTSSGEARKTPAKRSSGAGRS
ncbi:MAG: hypothetical protein ACRD0Z_12760 [Acidimicrobiales bacterium]